MTGRVRTASRAGSASPSTGPVDPMQSLCEAYKAARVAMTKARTAEWAALRRARAHYPKAPKALRDFATENEQLIPDVEYPYPDQRRVLVEAQMREPARSGYYSMLLSEWGAWERACRRVDAARGVPARKYEAEKAERAWAVACARFADTPTTSPLGILLKLEYVADQEAMAEDHAEHPSEALPRVILGLIRDLKADLTRPDRPATHRPARVR